MECCKPLKAIGVAFAIRLLFAQCVAEFATEEIAISACYHCSNIPPFHYSMGDNCFPPAAYLKLFAWPIISSLARIALEAAS